MKRFLLLLCSLFLLSFKVAFSQQSGAQTLRLAQSIYEQGRLHEIPDLLSDAKMVGFSKAERVSAYRLLTLSYIYLEEPEKADVAMQKLLQTDHFFEPNANVEPAEFMGLYKTFRTKPVFSGGLKFGGNFTTPFLSDIYYVSATAPGKGKYAPGFGFQIGVVFEKEFFVNSRNKFLRRITFAPEAIYMGRTFDYTNPDVFTSIATGASAADQVITVKQQWLDINAIFQLKLNKSNALSIYTGLGPGISYLLGASNTMVTTRASSVGVVSGPDVDFKDSYKTLVPSATGLAGVKLKFGDFYIVGELKVQYSFLNPVDNSARSVPDAAFGYAYVLPNYKPLNLTANIGFIIPYFNPIKLSRK